LRKGEAAFLFFGKPPPFPGSRARAPRISRELIWRLARSVTVHRSGTIMLINVIGTVMQGTRPTGKIM
jgi:hypothetical protein